MGIPLEGQSGTLLRFIALGGSSRHGIHRSGNYNYIFSGIKATLDSMPDNGVILVFTDTGSHQLDLENVIKKKMKKKNVKIFFAIYPGSLDTTSPYYSCAAPSLEVYKRLSKEEMFYASQDLALYGTLDLDTDKFFKAVVHTVRKKL